MTFRVVLIASLLISSTSAYSAEWIELNLNQIEVAPSTDANGESIYFYNPTKYVSQYSCSKGNYISIKEAKLADRALSLALYAKSTGETLKAYVKGCDSNGHLDGANLMLKSK